MREERVFLEYGIYGSFMRRKLSYILSVEKHLSRGRNLKSRNHSEGSRLTAAGGTEESYEFSFFDFEIHIVDYGFVAVLFGQSLKFDNVFAGIFFDRLGILLGNFFDKFLYKIILFGLSG